MSHWPTPVVLACACLFVLSGCSKDPNNPDSDPGKTLSVDKDVVVLSENNQPQTIHITAEGEWKVLGAESLWYTVEPLSGSGDGTLTITPIASDYREINKTYFSVMSGNSSVKIELSQTQSNQPPAAPELTLPQNEATDVAPLVLFQWKEAIDPDGDKVTYRLEFSTDQTNWTTISEERISSNTGYIDYGSPLQSNTKYYWRVTAIDMQNAENSATTSEIFSFTTGDNSGSWADGEVRVYQENTVGGDGAFTLIVTGDGFTQADLVNGGDWEQVSAQAIEGLFGVEPFKTYRSYIRVLRIGAVSADQGTSYKANGTAGACLEIKNTRFGTIYDVTNSAWCGLYTQGDYEAEKYWPPIGHPGKTIEDADALVRNWVIPDYIANDDAMNDVAIIVLMNNKTYNGTVNYYSSANTTMGFVCRSPGSGQTGFINTFVHEVGGHAIGHLADEYISSTGSLSDAKRTQTLSFQRRGFYENVDVTGSRETSVWKDFFTAPEYNVYYSNVGYIEGARSVAKGIWRAEYSSCMVKNELYFNPVQRRSIVKRLMKCAGEEYSWKAFVSKDYERNAETGTRAILTEDPNFVPLPEPQVVSLKR